MKQSNELVLATRNPHKVEELRHMLEDLDITIHSALDFENLEDVVEDSGTISGNAQKKALYVHEQTGLPALADDTGLEVDALEGAPGVYSSRYAGEDATYEENVSKLLRELEGVEDNERTARFKTVMALVTSQQKVFFEGVCDGFITKQRRGDKGFGYDPIFQPEGFNKTYAEMNAEQKNEISHRAIALRKFLLYLENIQE